MCRKYSHQQPLHPHLYIPSRTLPVGHLHNGLDSKCVCIWRCISFSYYVSLYSDAHNHICIHIHILIFCIHMHKPISVLSPRVYYVGRYILCMQVLCMQVVCMQVVCISRRYICTYMNRESDSERQRGFACRILIP